MWYAIQTRVRREEFVATLLAGKGYEIFLPAYVSERPWRGRYREVKSPLFPGYLFGQFDVQKRLPILVTPGVVGVVGNGRTPIAVPHSEISAIRNLVLSGVPAEPWPYLECGQRIRITEHALEGLEGILVGHKGGHRIVVSVTLLRRSVALEIHRSNVVPVQPEYKASDECISEGVLDEVTV
jgi:transcription antitermination factor NusG